MLHINSGVLFCFCYRVACVFRTQSQRKNHSRNFNFCLIWRQGRKNVQKNFFKLFRQTSVKNLDRQKNNFVTV